MVNRMRHTRAHRDNRRSHHALASSFLGLCDKCNKPKLPHRLCLNCGNYHGREVVDLVAKLAKKNKKSQNKSNQ